MKFISRCKRLKSFEDGGDDGVGKVFGDCVDCRGLAVKIQDRIRIEIVLLTERKAGIGKKDFIIKLVCKNDFRRDDDVVLRGAAV